MSNELMKSSNANVVQKVSTPTDLGMNALAFASNGTTADSAIISMVGVYSFNLIGQANHAGTLFCKIYDTDGLTALMTINLATAIAANTTFDFHCALELAPSIIGTGAIGTALYLPQRAISFGFTNTDTNAGTITARMIQALY